MNANILPAEKLAVLQHQKPRRLISLIRLIWPEIKAVLAVGHTVKDIHEGVTQIGIEIRYETLAVYVSRMLREDPLPKAAQRARPVVPAARPQGEDAKGETAAPTSDPLANFRESCINNPPPRFNPKWNDSDKSKLI